LTLGFHFPGIDRLLSKKIRFSNTPANDAFGGSRVTGLQISVFDCWFNPDKFNQ
jgi:hypothetical protein